MQTAVDAFVYILGALIFIWLFVIGILIVRREARKEYEYQQAKAKDDPES
jgi:hypothetical protein